MSEVVKAELTELSDEMIATMGRDAKQAPAKWLTEYYGGRCEEYCDLCPCCTAWRTFDELFGGTK